MRRAFEKCIIALILSLQLILVVEGSAAEERTFLHKMRKVREESIELQRKIDIQTNSVLQSFIQDKNVVEIVLKYSESLSDIEKYEDFFYTVPQEAVLDIKQLPSMISCVNRVTIRGMRPLR